MIEIIFIYLLLSIGLGLYASKFVSSSKDFITTNRKLPLYFILAMVFATWFGAETVLGISATFLEEGLSGLASDPIGASACLIIFGLFFAKKLYKLNLLTLGDFFRKKYNKEIEFVISLCIIISYLGWISAQITALGLVFFVLSDGGISQIIGMIIGSIVVLLFTLFGGMYSIAITTFLQMIVIILGLLLVSFEASSLAGGIIDVFSNAKNEGKLEWLPSPGVFEFFLWIGAFLTMALGSIPQQDVFQRANAAKSEKVAVWGTTLGGALYLVFSSIPLFLAYTSFIIDPVETSKLMEQDSQLVLPNLVLNHMPNWLQIIFFGSLLSVILSTASGTLLAPSILFTNNIIKYFRKNISDKELLLYTRITIIIFTSIVVLYATNNKYGIHQMVENSYRITLAGAFVPLVAGLFWSKSNNLGAILSLIMGIGTWLIFEFFEYEFFVEPQIFGLVASTIGMILGSNIKTKIN